MPRANTVRSAGAVNSVYFTNQEFIGDINVPVPTGTPPDSSFQNCLDPLNGPGSQHVMYINAGNAKMFPWLSGLAAQFETYRFIYLRFELRTVSGEYASSGIALGTMSMVIQYNAQNAAFTGKTALLNYDGAVTAKPSSNITLQLDHSKSMLPQTHFYVSSNTTGTPSGDIRMTYPGWLQVVASGIPTTTVAGAGVPTNTHQLWVTYRVELLQPKLVPTS